ncbi:M48 family metalloprotease [Mycolicibacterium celeriflavum]|uniref:Ste24 endopeptidase n=1 Tax=Mycolicibacterium celeriflavum TaxID=1249101 RepID=A0A7I7RN97_MYCCF|nr:M48 family metalloprotease [Mycolicibacterium celeriflavum]MCV7237955.1 M48 family metalloprotease [Mycolicibacterium celeriflavum]BBY46042.1 Ste24 endopeptidase [Mycolicibacterium celeriflavum]
MGAALWGASAFLLLRTQVPALDLERLSPASYFSPVELDRIHEFRRVTFWFWIASTLIQLGVLTLLAWRGRRLAFAVRRILRLPPSAHVWCGAAVAASCWFILWLTVLPVGAVRHWWYRRYGLREQDYRAWLGDQALELLVTTVVIVLVVSGMVYLAVRFGRRWWLAGSAAIAVFGLLGVLAQPLVIEPLFNRFTPVGDQNLAARIETLGNRLGVSVESVDVSDASRRTTTANAKVTGIGPTRRVVLYDTVLDGRFTEGEILWVSAHELAHVARGHVWKNVAWFALFATPGLAAIAWITERRGGLRDPAGVPLALVCAFVLSLLVLPAQNSISRRYEAESDWLALRVTNDPASDIATQRRFALTGLNDPDPPAWALFILGTHPTTMQRIAMAKAAEGR